MSEWIDITRTLRDGMSGWPGDPPLRLRPLSDLAVDGVNVSEICTSAHIGTHIDAPLHCLANGGDIASLSLDVLCGRAVVLDIAGTQAVSVDDLRSAPIQPGDRGLLRLGGQGRVEGKYRALTIEAAEWLIQAGAVLVGLDSPSPDPADSSDLPAHRVLLGAGLPIIENLDLTAVHPGRYDMIALPLRIAGGEASPARVILREKRDTFRMRGRRPIRPSR